jgi:hypothetical protein
MGAAGTREGQLKSGGSLNEAQFGAQLAARLQPKWKR